MGSLNKVILVGNLGKDPELRDINGTTVANFSIATNESWKDKASGERKDRTEWHRIVAWGRQAEVIGEYMKAGSQILIEGQLQTREWLDKEEHKHYTTEIRVSSFQMMGSKNGNGNGNGTADTSAVAAPEPVAVGVTDADDVPF